MLITEGHDRKGSMGVGDMGKGSMRKGSVRTTGGC